MFGFLRRKPRRLLHADPNRIAELEFELGLRDEWVRPGVGLVVSKEKWEPRRKFNGYSVRPR